MQFINQINQEFNYSTNDKYANTDNNLFLLFI